MAASPPVRFDWTRYWVPRGQTAKLSGGYLVPREGIGSWHRTEQTSDIKTLAELEPVRCLVLLGDLGLGKSVEIEREAERLERATADGVRQVLRVDLKRRSAELIKDEVFRDPKFIGWVAGGHELVLLLDSMDECWRRVTELAPLLMANLRPYLAKAGKPLFLRLSCRAAEWQDEIEAELGKGFGGKDGQEFQVWQLAPLTFDDVRVAAEGSRIDAQRFMAEVGEKEVGALAAHPITLNMLLAVARKGGALGRNREEIYQRGCELLCQDTHVASGTVSLLTTSAQQRFEAAGYMAAAGVLTNRYLVFGSPEERPGEMEGVIAGVDLIGPWIGMDVVRKNLERKVLAETLQTGLFESQPNGFHTWRHQSYGEFLAARYLQERKLPVEQYLAVMCDTSSGRPRIWPQLEETACWLVVLVPILFARLARDNADLFLRCDPAKLGPEQRKLLTQGYLAQVRESEGRVPPWDERAKLDRLRYPGMGADLAPVIRDRTESWVVRDLAVDIARSCELTDLTEVYFEVFTDPSDDKHVRDHAGAALRDVAGEEEKRKLKGVYRRLLVDDPDDQARGNVLQLLWPDHLTAQELVPLLTLPQKDNFSGAYKHFLADAFDTLRIEDLPGLLRWVRGVEPDSDHMDNDPYDGMCGRILLAGYRELENPEVREEFFQVVAATRRRDGRLFRKDGRDLASEEPLRKIFWREAVRRGLDLVELAVGASLPESGLLVADDFRWQVEEVRTTTGNARARWLKLVIWSYSPEHFPAQLGWMQPLVDEDAEAAKNALIKTSSELRSGERDNWRKKHHYDKVKADAERASRPTFGARVDAWLDKYEAGGTGWMWVLMEQLLMPVKEMGEDGYQGSDWGWKHINAAQRERIRKAAPGFLEGVQPNAELLARTDDRYRPFWAGVRLMLELASIESAWLKERPAVYWKVWGPVLFLYYDSAHRVDSEPWEKLFGAAYRKAPEEFYAAFERWFATRSDRHIPVHIFNDVPVLEDPRLEEIILQAAAKFEGQSSNDFYLFSFLLANESKAAETLLRSWQKSGHPKTALAEALLLNHCAERGGEEVLARMQADLNWGRTVLGYLNSGGSMQGDYLSRVTEESLAQYWEWLDANFPRDPYFEDREGTVTLDHQIYHLKNAVLNHLENRGTTEAVAAMATLVERHPEWAWLGQTLAKARYARRRTDWKPPPVTGMLEYLRVPTQKPLCSDADLCDAVLASLARYQNKLKQDNPLRELWNKPGGTLVKLWSPVEEREISNCLARHLETDLAVQGVTVPRESEIRAKTGTEPGNEPDIVAYAPSAAEPGVRLKVPIEIKGAWNTDVVESVATQLHDRYMLDARCGIHVTGYFTCASWPDEDWRKRSSLSRETPKEALRQLEARRDRGVAASGKRVEVVLLDARV